MWHTDWHVIKSEKLKGKDLIVYLDDCSQEILSYRKNFGKMSLFICMQSFWESDFETMWPVFSEAKRIIGFNTLRFDVLTLKPYAPAYFSKLPHFDIYAEIKKVSEHAAGLNAIAKETLDREKTDDGLNAVYYWEKHDDESLAKLKKYCEADVLITRDVYDHVLKNKLILFKDKWNTLRNVPLDFSYPEEKYSDTQTSLF